MFKAIVNVDKNWAIGNKGDLLFPIKADLKYFAGLTTGNVIVMGRKTLDSLPGGKPLGKRENIVLSTKDLSQTILQYENLASGNSIDVIKDLLKTDRYTKYENVFIIGGQSVYEQFLPDCDTVYVTQVDSVAAQADSFFPNLDSLSDWRVSETSDLQTEGEISYRYITYCRC